MLRWARERCSVEVPDCNWLSLRFTDRKTEDGFLSTRKSNLIFANRLGCSMAVLLGAAILWHNVAVVDSLDRQIHLSDLTYEIGLWGFRAHCAGLGVAVLQLAFVCSPQAMCRVKTRWLEASTTFTLVTGLALVLSAQTDIVTKIYGHDPRKLCMEHHADERACYLSDSWILMFIVSYVTVVNRALPLRWCFVLPVGLLGVLVYVAIASVLGSNEPRTNSTLSLVFLTIFFLTTCWSKRVDEIRERRSFATIIEERSKRCRAEFELAMLAEERAHDKSCQRRPAEESLPDSALMAPSVATATPSGAIFDPFFGVCEDMASQLARVAELGDAEHWHIRAGEVDAIEGQPLGAGSFGVVERACFCGMVVAMKRPRRKLDRDDLHCLPELCNELRVLRRLRHPNIVSVHGAVVEPDERRIALVLELVRGTTLTKCVAALAERRRPEDPQILPKYCILVGVCRALLYMHTRIPHIVHGDLKSGNIMVESGGASPVPKLLDFGLARVLTRNARKLGGTPAWMAPEVCAGKGPAKCSADSYSFGRLIAFVATEILPLANMTRSQAKKVLRAGRPPPAVWPPECAFAGSSCESLVEDCIAADEAARPSMASILKRLSGLPRELGLEGESGSFVGDVQLVASQDLLASAPGEAVRGPQQPEAAAEHERERATDSALPPGPLPPLPEDGPLPAQAEAAVPPVPEVPAAWRRIPHLPRTCDESMMLSLLVPLMRWNIELKERPCCHLHGAYAKALKVIRACQGPAGCTSFPSAGSPCPECGILDFEGDEGACDVCGFEPRSASQSQGQQQQQQQPPLHGQLPQEQLPQEQPPQEQPPQEQLPQEPPQRKEPPRQPPRPAPQLTGQSTDLPPHVSL